MSSQDMTVKQIKQELDAQGVEYNNRALKDDLLKLLDKHSIVEDMTKEDKPKQKSYKVVHRFKDLQDGNRIYRPGDTFNWVGKSKERIKNLSTTHNKIGKVLIKETD